jgi:steroid 5-alpha reductase family enzyme
LLSSISIAWRGEGPEAIVGSVSGLPEAAVSPNMAQRGAEGRLCGGYPLLPVAPEPAAETGLDPARICGGDDARGNDGGMMTVVYLEALAGIAVALAALMAGAWVVQQRTGNSGWVDTIWTFSLGLTGAASALAPIDGAPNARQWLVAALVALWSVRLGSHIAARPRHITDDPRYAAYAAEWGNDAPKKMFLFLQNQAYGTIPLVFSIFVAAHAPAGELRLQDWLGALILALGIGGEALADSQLKAFRSDPANKGKVCDTGLWRWSRHPNYFFQWFGWLAYPVIAIPFADPLSYLWGYLSLLAPVFMYWILVHVTGVPPLEEQMLKSRGERYRDYQARTSMFFPLPPRSRSAP